MLVRYDHRLPFCDGYENKDRPWGIVPRSEVELGKLPKVSLNWTSDIKVFLPTGMKIDPAYRHELLDLEIAVHEGTITQVHHTAGKVEAVTRDSGERIEVEILLWKPQEKPSPLIQNLVNTLGLELEESGYVKTDECQQTNVKYLWAPEMYSVGRMG